MKRLLPIVCVVLLLGIVGCAESKPTNMVEGVDPQDVADYDQMIADEENRMTEAEVTED